MKHRVPIILGLVVAAIVLFSVSAAQAPKAISLPAPQTEGGRPLMKRSRSGNRRESSAPALFRLRFFRICFGRRSGSTGRTGGARLLRQ